MWETRVKDISTFAKKYNVEGYREDIETDGSLASLLYALKEHNQSIVF